MSETEFNAADPKQVKKRTDSAKLRKENQDGDLKWLLDQPQFRRYIWRHMNETCKVVGKSAFSPNGSLQSHDLGMQDVGSALWVEIEAIDPLMIPKMMIEWHEAHKDG